MKTLLPASLLFLIACHSFSQGDLNPPPGPPAPTMKTLDQVEARTPVDAAHTPGDATSLFVISAPGSYFLTGNITGVSGLDGIRIASSDVTLDLNGFAVSGGAGTGNGIITTEVRNVTVRQGTVRAWAKTGVDASLASNSVCDQVRASNNGTGGVNFGSGISFGFGCVITRCAAMGNSAIGIVENGGGAITDCVAQGNGTSGFGDLYPGGSVFAHCAARANTGTGFGSAGGSTFTACTAQGNTGNGFGAGSDATVTGCTATGNSTGIFCVNTSTISNCTVTRNRDDGINTFGSCFILQNTVCVNGTDGSGDGIRTIEAGNRIDGNITNSNAFRGIRSTSGDVITRNTSLSNSAGAYAPGTSSIGPIGSPATATSPWANF